MHPKKIPETSELSLRNGQVSSGPNYVATEWAANTLHFEPTGQGANSFTWKTEGPDRWTAQLLWKENGEAKERTYVMTRVLE